MSKYNLERATDFGGENSSDYKTTSINTVYNKAKTLNEQLTNKNIYRFIKTITVVPDSYVGNLNPKIDVAELHNGVDYKYSYIKVKSPWHAWINVNKIVSENTFELCNTGENEITLAFDSPQRAVAPGQAAVCYDGDCVICGGRIVRGEN